MLNYSIAVIRNGQQVLTSEVSEGDLIPGCGDYDPDTRRRGLGTFEQFVSEFTNARTPRPSGQQGPNYSI